MAGDDEQNSGEDHHRRCWGTHCDWPNCWDFVGVSLSDSCFPTSDSCASDCVPSLSGPTIDPAGQGLVGSFERPRALGCHHFDFKECMEWSA